MSNTEKIILDTCCGSRMFWFDKKNPLVMFADIRNEVLEKTNGQALEIKPDVIADFTNMPFEDDMFNIVVFDPPHRTDLTKGNWMDNHYGTLFPTWQEDIRKGINECMRVLKPGGTLIFKWNVKQISIKKILSIIEHKPLFGHTTSRNTIWMAFIKIPI